MKAKLVDRFVLALPRITGSLWYAGFAGLLLLVPGTLGLVIDSELPIAHLLDRLDPEYFSFYGTETYWAALTSVVVFSLLSRRAERQKWRSGAWISLIAWLSFLVALNAGLVAQGLPLMGQRSLLEYWFLESDLIGERVSESAVIVLLMLANLRLVISFCFFSFVFRAHQRRYRPTREYLPLRRDRLFAALTLSFLTSILIECFPPFTSIMWLTWVDSDFLYYMGYLDNAFMALSGFAVFAWVSSASLRVDSDRLRFAVGGGTFELFSVSWARIQCLTRITGRHIESIRIDWARLPWFRFWLSVRRNAINNVALDQVLSEASAQQLAIREVQVRRGVARAGRICLTASILLVVALMMLMRLDVAAMAAGMEDDLSAFIGRGRFIEYGFMVALTALIFGLGLGFLFMRTAGGIRAWHLLAVGGAVWAMPDAIIYWLVYIAEYAILSSRLGPIEPVPWVPFGDVRAFEAGLTLVYYKGVVAILGYLIAAAASLRPWYRVFPAWTYGRSSGRVARETAPNGRRMFASH